MNYSELFDTIDKLNEKYIKVWEDVCNIESPSSCKAGVDKVGRYFADMAEQKGWRVERHSEKVSGDVVCITLNPYNKAAPIVFSAHMDTVHPIGLFGYPPTRIEDGCIYGPGTCDCKGGAVAAFLAMDALDACGFNKRPVHLLLQSDEEVSSRYSYKNTIEYICDKAKGAIAFLNMEGESRGKACIERKGIATYKFTVMGKEAHASKCSDSGASAILEAAHKIIELEKMKDPDGITCNCGLISGGSVPNTVPAKCEFVVDTRFATLDQYDIIEEEISRVAENSRVSDCRCEVELISARVPMERCERNIALLDAINEIYKECGLPTLEPMMRGGGSDAADVTVSGTPCVDSLGVNGHYIHTVKEYALLDSLCESAKRVAAVALGIQ